MKTFHQLLANTLVANVTNNFLWFAVVFWAYLETRSVLATAIIGGSFMLLSAFSGVWFGTFADNHKKKTVMLVSSVVSLLAFLLAGTVYLLVPEPELLNLAGPLFWLFTGLILVGAVSGTMRLIAISTLVTLLVVKERHAKANGLVGTANGVAFAITSVFSGLAIGQFGMRVTLYATIALTVAVLLHLLTIRVPEKQPIPAAGEHITSFDFSGALTAVRAVPGLFGLILFTTFNNLLGGVFMSLMDAYGLELVSVENWGFIWGFASMGYIIGGAAIAKWGLGESPLRSLAIANLVMWAVSIAFPSVRSVALLILGSLSYMLIFPVIEAAEQTMVQRVVPFAKQGRVFGFAQTVETAAAPITAFLIGPIAQFFVIPWMTDGAGVDLIGHWFGTGPDRGMALIFITAGIIGIAATLWVFSAKFYRLLNRQYAEA